MPIHVDIVTPAARIFQGEAGEVQAPGFLGEFGVLPQHTLFLSVVRPGVVTVHLPEGPLRFVVGRGFAEAGPDRLSVLTELAEAASDVDVDSARAALEGAERTLAEADPGSGEWRAAEHEAELSRARLAAAGA